MGTRALYRTAIVAISMSKLYPLAVFLLSGLLFLAPPSAATLKHLQVGLEAPGFTLKRTQGDPVSLDDLLGERLTLLIFWASWSAKSEMALKRAQLLFERQGGRGLSVVGINSEGGNGDLREIVASTTSRLKLGFPNLIDYRLNVFSDYGVIALPTIVILDKERTIRYELSGFPTAGVEEMASFVTATLEGKKPPLNKAYQPSKRASLLFNMGNRMLLGSRSRAAAAEQWFLKAVAADAKYSAPHLALGRLYLERSQLDKAKSHLRAAISIAPENAVALCELGMILIDSGEGAEGEALIAKGMRYDEAYTPCYYYLGYAYGKRPDISEALEMFEKAKEINQADPEIYRYQGRVFEAHKNYSAAAESYRESLRRMLKL